MQDILARLSSPVEFAKDELNHWRRSLNAVHRCRQVFHPAKNEYTFLCRHHDHCAFLLRFRPGPRGGFVPCPDYSLECGRLDEIQVYNQQVDRVLGLRYELLCFFKEDQSRLGLRPSEILNHFFASREAFSSGIEQSDLLRKLRKKFDNVVNEAKRRLADFVPEASKSSLRPFSILGFPMSEFQSAVHSSDLDKASLASWARPEDLGLQLDNCQSYNV